jgi:hypothetical protein
MIGYGYLFGIWDLLFGIFLSAVSACSVVHCYYGFAVRPSLR